MNTVPTPGPAPGPGAGALLLRMAAYLLIFSAGTACACLGWAIIFLRFGYDFRHLLDVLNNSASGASVWQLLAAGAAAVIAAGLVHAPFMRAVREQRRRRLYARALLGVLAAHAAYAVLILLVLNVQKPLAYSGNLAIALMFGLYSLILGFLPNLLFAIGLGEALLAWARRQQSR